MDTPKTTKYLTLIQTYVIDPLDRTTLSQSCFATVLMLCGCIDGFGKLIHPDEKARSGERFKYFLERLGPRYKESENELWELRNDLAHNALNVAAYLSHVHSTSIAHLKKSSCGQYLLLNTQCLLNDFKQAFNTLRDELSENPELAARAENAGGESFSWIDSKPVCRFANAA